MQIMPEHDHNNEFVSPPDITNEHLKQRILHDVFQDDYSFIGPFIYKYHMKLKKYDKELYQKCPGQQHEMLVKLVNFREFFLKLDDFIYNSNENQSQKIENNYKIDLGIRIY